MEKINAEVIRAIQEQIGEHLKDYQPELNEAFEKMEEVSISLNCKLLPEGDKIQAQTSISFISGKVKDKGMIII